MQGKDKLEALFPTKVEMSPEDLAKRYQRLTQVKYADTRQHFSVAIPNGWVADGVGSDLTKSGRFQSLMTISPPAPAVGRLEISVGFMQREANPSDWVKITLDEAREEILAMREMPGQAGTLPDLLSIQRHASGTPMRRTIALRDGKRVWLISAQAPEAEYKRMAASFLFCLGTFKLLSPERVDTAENISQFVNTQRVRFDFKHPDSWKVVPLEPRGPNNVRLSVETEAGGKRAGSVTVQVWAKQPNGPSEVSLLNGYFKDLENSGVQPKKAPWIILNVQSPLTAMTLTETTGAVSGQGVSLTTVLMQYQQAWVLLGLMSLNRTSSPEWWAINKKAFEIIQQSFKLL